jgi:hypothetical protein
MEHFRVLEFNLHDALVIELTSLFEQMSPAELNNGNANAVQDGQGVYQLFYRGELVYVGKTDNEAGLRKRLLRHCGKVRSRLNLDPSEVHFKAVRIYVFTAMDLETALIKHYKRAKKALAWNQSGFGSNDPGRKRDHSELKKGHFDALYPIDLDLEISLEDETDMSAASLLTLLKDKLAYTVRFQGVTARSKRPHPELVSSKVSIDERRTSVRSILLKISTALGKSWQVTALPGHVIIYRERRAYEHGIPIRATNRAPSARKARLGPPS